jgi:hypothetical protein
MLDVLDDGTIVGLPYDNTLPRSIMQAVQEVIDVLETYSMKWQVAYSHLKDVTLKEGTTSDLYNFLPAHSLLRILEGSGAFVRANGSEYRVAKAIWIYVPSGVDFYLRNTSSDSNMRFVWVPLIPKY